jgi:ribosomal protein S18 acetylase RimI-like enzyme
MTTIVRENPASPDAQALLARLSETLEGITGDSGNASFNVDDVRADTARFVIARDHAGKAVGCGAFRPLQDGIAEVKRMYSCPETKGVGAAILAFLESEARSLGYVALWLETRLVNERAVRFYERHGYRRIPNFGKYAGNPKAVCFEKRLSEPVV